MTGHPAQPDPDAPRHAEPVCALCATTGPPAADAAAALAEATAARTLAAARHAQAEDQWRAAIRAAFAADVDVAVIQTLGQCSRSRAYQIRGGRTGHERRTPAEETP